MKIEGLAKRFMERQRRKEKYHQTGKEEKRNFLLSGQTTRNNVEAGKIYYSICPDNPKWFRSIRLAVNPFTHSLVPQISNPIEGTPPSELEEISPVLLQRLMRMPQSIGYQGDE